MAVEIWGLSYLPRNLTLNQTQSAFQWEVKEGGSEMTMTQHGAASQRAPHSSAAATADSCAAAGSANVRQMLAPASANRPLSLTCCCSATFWLARREDSFSNS